ncbi:MAG TPA: T9SS type A sorting domain-containing protein [Candidatus Kapabacteria bacterium]|nr:T9SS type A sorting domain-containing protein [Candidatus Kapabacteria bacterium]
MKNLVLLVALLLATITLQAGELKFGWNLANEAGGIQDMKFMPNQDQFLVLAGLGDEGVLQLRNTETGELIKSTPLPFVSYAKFEFTPDSTKIILTNGKYGDICLYNLKDLSLIKKYDLKRDTVMSLWFSNIAVDPIRPYVYVTLYANSGFPDYLIKGQVSVYNYETMEFVKDLTTYDNTSYDCLAISKDGKYLAAMNQGKTYLKVWDLSTFELKSDFCLYDKNLQFDYECTPKELKFSDLNTDNIYYTGHFPLLNGTLNDGLFIYNIKENKITNDSFKEIVGGPFLFFENENKIMNSNGFYLTVLNMEKEIIEFSTLIWDVDSLRFANRIIYSEKYKSFIGNSAQKMSMVKYNNNTTVQDSINFINTIYPNPTTKDIIVKTNCQSSLINYKILNINSQILYESTINNKDNVFVINLSSYLNGVYFIQITCNDSIITYKIIKEN